MLVSVLPMEHGEKLHRCVSLLRKQSQREKDQVLACSLMNKQENLDRRNSVDIVTLGKCIY